MKKTTRRMAAVLALLLAAGVLSGCGGKTRKSYTVWHVSDLHYLAPELLIDRTNFEGIMRRGDGKATLYTPEITASFAEAALAAKPDAVVISGDLTLNGALESHRSLADILTSLEEAGIQVYVLPGNHDIGGSGYRFEADGPVPIPAAEWADFEEIYSSFGFSEALSRDESSLSYMAEIGPSLRILMIDTNTGVRGTVGKDTLAWAEAQLQEARELGCRVIGVSHQNLFRHSPLFTFGYELNNGAELAALYEAYSVELNLSGHLHIQHIAETESTADIALSALAVTPHQVGVLTAGPEGLAYHTEVIPVTAVINGETPDFAAFSAELFDECTEVKTGPGLTEAGITGEQYDRMMALAKQLNREYFWGAVTAPDEEALQLWEEIPGFHGGYLSMIAEEAGKDHNSWSKGSGG